MKKYLFVLFMLIIGLNTFSLLADDDYQYITGNAANRLYEYLDVEFEEEREDGIVISTKTVEIDEDNEFWCTEAVGPGPMGAVTNYSCEIPKSSILDTVRELHILNKDTSEAIYELLDIDETAIEEDFAVGWSKQLAGINCVRQASNHRCILYGDLILSKD